MPSAISSDRVIVFDRDNTLIMSDGYLGDPARVRLMPGAAKAVARAKSLGFKVVVVSNQSGVARGMFSEDAVRAVNKKVEEMLQAEDPGATIDWQEFCPFHPAAALIQYRQESDLRKPKPGMIFKACEGLEIKPVGWCVGDAPRDIAAGRAAGLRTILFKPQGVPRSEAADETVPGGEPEYEVTSLEAAMDIIERQMSSAPKSATPVLPVLDTTKMERLLTDLVAETKRANQLAAAAAGVGEFSVAKLLAGILQVLVLGLMLVTYFNRNEPNAQTAMMLLAGIFLQTLVTSLLLMGGRR